MNKPEITLSVLIVEDEVPARELLLSFVSTRPELKVNGVAVDGTSAKQELLEKQYDLVFMDIDIPFLNGLEILEDLPRIPPIIFTTAYSHYAVDAFNLGAVDYLLKPYSLNRFDESVNRMIATIKSNPPESQQKQDFGIFVSEGVNHFLVPYSDIIYVSSHGKKTVLHTIKKEIQTSRLLKVIEFKLPKSRFVRVHKQFIVNMKFISHIQYYSSGQYLLYLKDGEESIIPVSRLYAPKLKEKFQF
ncbi:hypothetical protein CH373_04930 [Leptospira perolatii]|uniref:DNA-binding response regulator n=1 Tax=Leptospira perolatii TaxID=2023191 RepID=A0A2M9ZQA4_9LEPT|nr:LytTR family DNA-binding domain-containing protein [Leptospira perolatii]PJZ70421.1 hypothetical protein CH360_05350 [Leptospira perolatii]PJZ74257.1 hypothetical protein CH373_04930 [Leptospira perolatii]